MSPRTALMSDMLSSNVIEDAYIQVDNLHWPSFNLSNPSTKNPVGYMMVPIATLGVWKHSVYGEVLFNQEVFDQIIKNFDNRVTGYEPPLYLGHESQIERPAIAYLESLAQQNDVLWGFYSVVDKDIYLAVKEDKYRYSSAELFTEAVDAATGESVGALLYACALTNTPFLTRQPAIRAFSNKFKQTDNKCFAFAFELNTLASAQDIPININMSNTISAAPQTVPAVVDTVSAIPSQVLAAVPTTNAPVVDHSQKLVEALEANQILSAANAGISAELADLKTKLETLSTENADFRKAFSANQQAARQATLMATNISAAAKKAFSLALNTPDLSDAAADGIIAEVVALGAEEESTFLTQQGENLSSDQQLSAVPTTSIVSAQATNPNIYSNYLNNRAKTLSSK